MACNIPNLLDGKTLTGVLPIDRQPPMEIFLPQYSLSIVDIEACIDDPSLAPLGHHVKKPITKRMRRVTKNTNDENHQHQVKIQPKHQKKKKEITELPTMGALMLRRQELDADQLAEKLDFLYCAPLTSFLRCKEYYDHLVELDISRNRLNHLPCQITKLKKLQNLNLSSNMLTKIPTELYSLKELEILNLSQNSLEIIPDEMPSLLPNLAVLRVAANRIYHLPHQIHLWCKLRHLQLGSVFGGNRLTQLPDSIVDMPVLEELDVSNNQLRSLPTHFTIQSLTTLNVSNNQLDFIPKSIAQCTLLKSLNLSKNHLTSLPASLVALSNLELFDISENLLCIVPADILERMPSTTLLITGNPLTRPGECNQQLNSQDAYARILKQMTRRVVTYSSPISSPTPHRKTLSDLCGPGGTGCLPASSTTSPSLPSLPSSPLISQVKANNSKMNTTTTTTTTSPSSPSFHYASTSASIPKPTSISMMEAFASASPISPSMSTPNSTVTSSHFSSPSSSFSSTFSNPPSPSLSTITTNATLSHISTQRSQYPIQDEDASIDHELSYHAQKLNINGSRPGTPIHESDHLIGTSRSTIVQETTRHSECTVIDASCTLPPTATRLFNSLLEIATRHVLKSNMEVPPDYLPPHLQQMLYSGKCRLCAYCQGPFVSEWVSSVQVKSFGGHPAVVRKVRFCSTECWLKCLYMDNNEHSKSVICVHRAHG